MLKNFFDHFYPRDVIGFLTLGGGFYLLYSGIDTIVGGVVIAVVTFYFVRKNKHDNTKTDQSEPRDG